MERGYHAATPGSHGNGGIRRSGSVFPACPPPTYLPLIPHVPSQHCAPDQGKKTVPGRGALRSKVVSIGACAAPQVMPNSDLESMAHLETSDQWIASRTGITQRHLLPDDVGLSVSFQMPPALRYPCCLTLAIHRSHESSSPSSCSATTGPWCLGRQPGPRGHRSEPGKCGPCHRGHVFS